MTNRNLCELIGQRDEFMKAHDFSKYSIKEMEKIIEGHFTIELVDYFKDDLNAIKWFYSPAPVFNGETPNNYCKLGSKYIEKVQDEIGKMINSNFN